MDEVMVQNILDAFLKGQQEALAAYTVALARVVGQEQLAEALRLQVLSFNAGPRADSDRWRDALLNAAWKAIRYPVPPGV